MNISEKDLEKKRILYRVVSDMGGSVEDFIQERNCYIVNLAGRKMLLEHCMVITRDPHVGAISTKSKDVAYKLPLNQVGSILIRQNIFSV